MPDSPYDPFPVSYVLYSHYSQHEGEDLKSFTDAKAAGADSTVAAQAFKGIRHLTSYIRGMRELLEAPAHEGVLILFYAAGIEQYLDSIGDSEEKLIRDHPSIAFAKQFSDTFRSTLKSQGLANRVRVMTVLDLNNILGQVNVILGANLHRYVAGIRPGIRYDVPKIPEAVLRLRLLGHGVPILRIDQDALFRDSSMGDMGLFKAVTIAVQAYRMRMMHPSVSTFMFSLSYNAKALLDRSPQIDRFEAWSRAFATRVQPSLVADLQEIRRVTALPQDGQNIAWDKYCVDHLDEEITRAYYGLAQDLTRVESGRGLALYGAHPYFAVISGALLCLSDGAILDLPPFSNFRTNVMW